MPKILVVDDDIEMASIITDWLCHEMYTVEVLHSGLEAEYFLKTYKCDAIILDWDLPDKSGVEVCRHYRKKGGLIPILLLTGKNQIAEKTEGLDSGAEDYLTKPFDLKELSARIRALLRRSPQFADNNLSFGNIELSFRDHTVNYEGHEIKLFPKEFTLLEFFMRHSTEIFDSAALLNHVWPAEAGVGTETVRQSIHRLRQQFDKEGEPSFIENVRGVGYRIRKIK